MELDNQTSGTGHIVDYNLEEEIFHGIYVSKLVYGLAQTLGLEEAVSKELAVAGVLHDIGKLKLNRYIYEENDTLVVEEIKYVRMHAKLSYEILKDQNRYSDFILESILHHHENYDGSGYPDNLKADAIPLGAKLLRVCDVYAALTSDRPYRSSFDENSAMELMIDEVKNFDLRVFLAFQKMIHLDEENFCPTRIKQDCKFQLNLQNMKTEQTLS
ncbi:MAG: HD domain-containing protein [Lachnospiraceae bacterium]|jgi:HD-GYP domain-containing protein (c-di-GMP phosphodiesterase class II)|nr:HD domain-containing protein [Lachnospiraceae bacterium]MDD3616969.1 HD domain-containing protein [Lachnospiraceae bacterium]